MGNTGNAVPIAPPPDWTEIQVAVQMFRSGTSFKQVKGEGWTVYKTASCIRIDIAITNSTEGEPAHA